MAGQRPVHLVRRFWARVFRMSADLRERGIANSRLEQVGACSACPRHPCRDDELLRKEVELSWVVLGCRRR
jgi:hypothetical protein